MKYKMIIPLLLCLIVGGQSLLANNFDQRNYTYIYFDQGYPTRLVCRRSQSCANVVARANPDVVIQTGYYSLRLDCDDMQITGFDALTGTDYMSALEQDVTVFTPADLELSVVKNGVKYTCRSAVVQDAQNDNVRLIEGGRYVQRFDHLGLVFTNVSGEVLAEKGRFELTAWADHVTFKLEFATSAYLSNTSVKLTTPSGKVLSVQDEHTVATLSFQPHLEQHFDVLDFSSYIKEAYTMSSEEALNVSFDTDEYALKVDIPTSEVSYPRDTNRVDEYIIEVTNPTDIVSHIPLIFDQLQPRAITGTVMVLADAESGRPTGIPIQISKDWHKNINKPVVHEGSWLRGYTSLQLAPKETKRFRLRVIYGYWGGVAAISHSQLCLIGWGCNWKWDESALGTWGESFTYDPTQHAGAAMMCDVRPSFTIGMHKPTAHQWTENVGGGDFLIYYDENNTFRWLNRVKTAYKWTGPNMTEVMYSGITDDHKIRATYTSRAVRTNDYHRRFHTYKYQFLEDVTSPKRLVFHQMAADYYLFPEFGHYYVGNADGLLSAYTSDVGGDVYKGAPIPFNDRWLVIDDDSCADAEAKARRGLLSMSSTLNGEVLPVSMYTYGRSWDEDDRTLFDLSAHSVSRSYEAGDVVTGELEFILPPKVNDYYWGSDAELSSRLDTYTTPWQGVFDEFQYNVNVEVSVSRGELQGKYPVDIKADTSRYVLADFVLEAGGIGHVPIIIRDVNPLCDIHIYRKIDGVWVALEGVDVFSHNYYQSYLNAEGRVDMVFNICRPNSDLSSVWQLRILTSEATINGTPYTWLDDMHLVSDGDYNQADSMDQDEDGLFNYEEFTLGTDPNILK